MYKTEFDQTAAQTPSAEDQAELTERELNDAVGGLLPAVGPMAVKGKCPTAVE